MKRRLQVGLLGAGRIAAGFDSPRDPQVLTLAHALSRSADFQLAGIFDRDPARAAAAERKWGCLPSPRTRSAWLDAGWDIVMIATPDAAHARDLEDVLARRPRGVWVEKPLALNGAEALRLLRLAQRCKVPLLVDFPRREHPLLQDTGRRLRAGAWGEVRRIGGIHSGGLKHNGVHLLDLVADWLPGIRRVRYTGGTRNESLLELDTTRGRVPLFLAAAPQTDCYVWELRIETERGRIELAGAPETLRLSRSGPHPNFPGFRALRDAPARSLEDAPLLLRGVERLARIVASPVQAQAQWRLEIQRQQFFNQVFDHCP